MKATYDTRTDTLSIILKADAAIAESVARHRDAAVAIIPEGPYVVPVHQAA